MTSDASHTLSPPLRIEPADDGRCLGAVDKRDGLTEKEFIEEYFKPRRPVVLQGLMEDWPAYQKWDSDYLRETWGDLSVPVGRCFEHVKIMPLSEYLDYMDAVEKGDVDVSEEPPLYMEGWYYKKDPQDTSGIMKDYPVLKIFDKDLLEAAWFPSYFDPQAHGLLIGAKGVFTKMHFDQLGTHSWNAHVVGRKRWALADPKYLVHAYEKKAAQTGGYLPGYDVEDPDLDQYPLLGDLQYWTSNVEPGEIMWFPSMWLHQVKSLDRTVGITHNYITGNNFGCFLRRFIGYRLGLLGR